jgi:hypothetical protein
MKTDQGILEFIELVKEVKDVHERYNELGFSLFNQDVLHDDPNLYTKYHCGCALHTMGCLRMNRSILRFEYFLNNFNGFEGYFLYQYLFANTRIITQVAAYIGFPKPEKFEVEDFVIRCDRVIDYLEGKNDETID